MSDSLRPHGLQHARLPCPSPSPRVCSDSCPLSQWCHPAISPPIVPSLSCFHPHPAHAWMLITRSSCSKNSSCCFMPLGVCFPCNFSWNPYFLSSPPGELLLFLKPTLKVFYFSKLPLTVPTGWRESLFMTLVLTATASAPCLGVCRIQLCPLLGLNSLWAERCHLWGPLLPSGSASHRHKCESRPESHETVLSLLPICGQTGPSLLHAYIASPFPGLLADLSLFFWFETIFF